MTGRTRQDEGVHVADPIITAVEETATKSQPTLTIDTSRQFTSWLVEHRLSLAFTTYQSGKLFFVGVKPDGKLWVHERTFNRCMGLAGDGQSLWMSSLHQLWRFGALHTTSAVRLSRQVA